MAIHGADVRVKELGKDTEPLFPERGPVEVEFGAYSGYLYAKGAGGTHVLQLFPSATDPSLPQVHVVEPTPPRSRWVIVPGIMDDGRHVEWHVFPDISSAEAIDEFLEDLRVQGCAVVLLPPGD